MTTTDLQALPAVIAGLLVLGMAIWSSGRAAECGQAFRALLKDPTLWLWPIVVLTLFALLLVATQSGSGAAFIYNLLV